MHVFKTIGVRTITWELAFSVAQFRRIKSLLGWDLMSPDKPTSEADPRTAILVMHQDLAAFVDAVFVACQEQAIREEISDVEFAGLLDEQAFVACRTAFFAEWEGFFARAGVTASAAALRKQMEILKLAGDRIAKIPAEHFMAEVDAHLRTLTGGSSSTSSPASSASIPSR